MKIKIEQLAAKLKNEPPAFYLISGDDFFLKEEALSSIRKKNIKNETTERLVFTIDSNFLWEKLFDEVLGYSLFSATKFIELHITNGKFSAEIKNKLEELFNLSLTDTVILISSPKLDASSVKSKWYSLLDKKGLHIEIWPIDEAQLPRWIEQRLQQAALPTDRRLIEAIASFTAGNLFATQQEIEKLSLISGSTENLIATLTEAMHYSSFDLVNQVLMGNLKNARVTLEYLQAENNEAILVLWALTQEIRLSHKVISLSQKGSSFQSACESLYIWPKRRTAIQHYIKRCSQTEIYQHLQHCSQIDKMIKGFVSGNPWFSLLELSSSICGVTVCG